MVSFDARVAGTPAQAWRDDPRLDRAAPLDVATVDRLVVVAAHPDDETLGAGGLIAGCAARGIPVTIVIVTDGAASHPDDVLTSRRRAREAARAVEVLAPNAELRLLGFPDGRTDEHRWAIRTALNAAIGDVGAGTRVAAPWRGDGHRDHRVVGELVADLMPAPQLWEYPIWMWHWADPADAVVPWSRARRASIDAAPKARAISAYASQTNGDAPQLLPSFLEHFRGDTELIFVAEEVPPALAEAARPAATVSPTVDTVGHEHFDALYARRADPWRVETRWYEQRKRALTLASLPHPAYASGLEVGCSIGVLTAELADRCASLHAIDVSAEAVRRTRERLDADEVRGVTVEQRDARELDVAARYDLIVLSEVGYYLDPTALDQALDRLLECLSDDGVLVACHWRHTVDGIPATGDQVHDALARRPLHRVARYRDDDVVLDVVSRDPRSVARQEGLA
ncbi:PIG-L family deacetylase [Microcella putealis]|uniref:PIG-L family deacetylase n=1 Tax=Microcella putealis TaxID=337005 RepID=UPI00102BD8E6|nr:PIG-L family deacetylase [Microcella putealis]